MIEKRPLFSVVVTAHNKGDYVESTIKSVLQQSIRDFEAIVIDDGSTDDTKEKILAINDDRIRYFYQPPSGLPAAARNRGIERARGEYISLLDGDDVWMQNKLKKTLAAFSVQHEPDIVCHDIGFRGADVKMSRHTHLGPYPDDIYGKLLWDSNCLIISTTTLKRDIFFKHNFWFDEDKKLFSVEDYDFWLRLAESGKFKFHYLPEVLAEHIVSERGIVLTEIDRNTENMLHLFDKNVAKEGSLNPPEKAIAKKRRASMMRGAGLAHNYKKDYLKSLQWFVRALKEYPLNINNYLGLILSLLRIRIGGV